MTSHSRAYAARLHLLPWLLLFSACGGGDLPRFLPNVMDSPDRDGGDGSGGRGQNMMAAVNEVTPENLDMLVDIGADLRDPWKICTGWEHSCAIDHNGKVWCWGVGVATMVPGDLPPQELVTCGIKHTCALDAEGVATCWGLGGEGSSAATDLLNQGQSTVPNDRYKEIGVGGGSIHTCAVDTDDDLVCWGAGAADKTAEDWVSYGQARPPLGKFKSVVGGDAHSCAIALQSGEVACWGGEGDGRCFPPLGFSCGQLNTPLGSWDQVAAGAGHGCALNTEGTIRCWGSGTSPEPCDPFNDGSLKDCGQAMPPTDVDAPFARINSGSHTTCAITEDYQALCWGWNDFGQTEVPPGAYAQIAPGDLHTCAMGVNGMPVCWGNNGYGQSAVPAAFPVPPRN